MIFALLFSVASSRALFGYGEGESGWHGEYVDIAAGGARDYGHVRRGTWEGQRLASDDQYVYVDAEQNVFYDEANMDRDAYVRQEARYLDPGYRPAY